MNAVVLEEHEGEFPNTCSLGASSDWQQGLARNKQVFEKVHTQQTNTFIPLGIELRSVAATLRVANKFFGRECIAREVFLLLLLEAGKGVVRESFHVLQLV